MFPTALVSLLLVGAAAAAGGCSGPRCSGTRCSGTRCYAAFSEPADFQTARDKCSEVAGHLMTVRTPDSHAVLQRVLERSAGPYWVGLYRPAGCPDPAGPMRGFRWEAGGRSSDFSNWAAAAERSGCTRQCVSVSSEDGFKWSAVSCAGRAAGFLCEYRRQDACEPTGASGSYTVPPHAGRRSTGTPLPHGTVATRYSDGSTSMCLSGEWVRAPWSCRMHEGGCEFKCGGTEDHPQCLCPQGHAVSPENRTACVEVQGDRCREMGCEHGCEADPPACQCRPGYQLGADGRSCREAPGAPRGLQACGRGFRPTVTHACVDVDECHQAPCEHDCINTPGSFSCSCFEGYVVDPTNPLKCKAYCGQPRCRAECDPNDPGQCRCPDGYILDSLQDEHFCVDIDECEMFRCDHDCVNAYGGYTCYCKEGFSLVEGSCVAGTVTPGSGAPHVPSPSPSPDPTGGPSRLSAGGLVAAVVAVAVVVFLTVFLMYHFCSRRDEARAASHRTAERGDARELETLSPDDKPLER